MSTLERFERLMSELDPGRRAELLHGAKRILDAIGHRKYDLGESASSDMTEQSLGALDRFMDSIEADACLAGEYDRAVLPEGQSRDAVPLANRLLGELELWVEANRRLRLRKLSPGRARCKTVERLQDLMPGLDSFQQDGLFDAASRLTLSWRGGWSELEPWERTIGVWRILSALNEQMDAMERSDRELLESEVAKSGSGGGVTREMATMIATDARRKLTPTLPERCTEAVEVTEEPPGGTYRVWEDEPVWCVWFRPNRCGLVSSDVVVVSKKTGLVVYNGSACDEG